MGRGKYGALRHVNRLVGWLLDVAFCAARAVLTGLTVAAALALAAATAIGGQLRQHIAASDLVMDPVGDDADPTDPTGPPVRATADRLDRQESTAA
jgi:hypothetical protein